MRVIPVLPVDFTIRFPIGRSLMPSFFLTLARQADPPAHGGAAHSKGALRDDSSSLHPGRQGSGAEVGRVQVQKIDLDNMLLGIHLIQVIHHSNDSFGTFYW